MLTLTIPASSAFQFKSTVESHGWHQLAPMHYDSQLGTLSRLHRLQDGTLIHLHMRDSRARSVLVGVSGRHILSSIQRNQIANDVRHMLNLDWNLKPFHDALRKHEAYQWVIEKQLGRLLAAPTVWEDLVKTLMTTNIAWANTVEICARLCAIDPDGTFPTAQQIAGMSEAQLNEQSGAGYRSPYLHELAQRIASGEFDVEAWRHLASNALYKQLKDLTGFGDYAAGTVMRLLGHFDRLAIDTVARKAYEEVTGEAAESDTVIRQYYEPFGGWRGLVLWMDSIREHYETASENLLPAQ